MKQTYVVYGNLKYSAAWYFELRGIIGFSVFAHHMKLSLYSVNSEVTFKKKSSIIDAENITVEIC